jgi:hypothetical protein
MSRMNVIFRGCKTSHNSTKSDVSIIPTANRTKKTVGVRNRDNPLKTKTINLTSQEGHGQLDETKGLLQSMGTRRVTYEREIDISHVTIRCEKFAKQQGCVLARAAYHVFSWWIRFCASSASAGKSSRSCT